MSPWSKRMLVAAMLIWSVLTIGVGWYALRGGGPAAAESRQQSAAGDATGLTGASASSPSEGKPGARQTSGASSSGGVNPTDAGGATTNVAGDPSGARTPTPIVSAEPSVRPPHSLQAVPAHAASAGVNTKVDSLNADGPRGAPSRPVSKGVIVLDPGHGRGDPGATHYIPDGSGRWDITEAESNQHNAELMRDDLVAMGYEVYLTRDGAGQGPGAPLPLQFITSDLYARVGLAKAVDADLYLAIHGNGASVPFLSGPETWYCGHHTAGAANEKLARLVQQAMIDALAEYGYFPPDRGIKEDAQSHHSGDFCEFVVTREAPTPAALLEFLFLSNNDDAKVLLDDRSHVLMAKHVAAAIDQFMQERAAHP